MMHDNYEPPKELYLKEGPPTEDGFYLIYISVPESYALGNAMLVTYDSGSFFTNSNPDFNFGTLLKGNIIKHVGPLPYRVK